MQNAILQRQSSPHASENQASQSEGRLSQAPPPFQLKASSIANSGAPIQRYPIAKQSAKKIEALSGRPNAKSNKGTVLKIMQQMWTDGPKNPLETKLKSYGSPQKAADEINSNNFLSKNDAAICHKQAISDIEGDLVVYGNAILGQTNSSKMDGEAISWIKTLTAKDSGLQGTALTYLKNAADIHKNASPLTDKATTVAAYLSDLLLLLDGSHTNLYIGYARTNSSIQDNFDPHYDVYSTTDPSATPLTTGIYNSQKSFAGSMGVGHSSPRREYDGKDYWNETSGLDDKGYIAYDYGSNMDM